MSRIARLAGSCSVLSLFLAATAHAEPRKPTHVACVGDSITEGSHASSAAKNYPSQLQVLLGNLVQVKNFGKSGATMLSEGFGDKPYTKQVEYTNGTDFVDKAGAAAVVSVIIILGANDSKPFNWDPATGKNAQQYLKDYRALVDHYAALATKPVIYVGYPLATGNTPCCEIRGNVIHDEQLPLIKQVATEKHLPIIDLNTPTTGHPEYFADGVHPNDGGYLVMANLVKKGLEREPTVSITSPTAGQAVSAGMLPLTADASGDTVDISSVEFFEGTTSLGKVTAKPFTLTWAATPGAHQITAKATDTTLANATSSVVSFTVSEGAVGGSGGGNAGGAAAAGGGGATSGGTVTGGTGTAGSVATGGAAGMLAAGGAAGSSTTTADPAASDDTDSGCSCSIPGSRRGNANGLLLAASLLSLLELRRRVKS